MDEMKREEEDTTRGKRDFLLQLPRAIVEMSVVTLIIAVISGMFFFDFTKSEIILYVSLLIVAVKGSELQPFDTGTTSLWPDKMIGFLLFEFLAFSVANKFTLFFSSS